MAKKRGKKTTAKKSVSRKPNTRKAVAKKSSKGPIIVFGLIIIVIVLILAFALTGGKKYPQSEVDAFAKCLTENEVVMYGAFWCPHCAKTKKNFGSSFQYINYVECDPKGDNEQSELCIERGIDKYDTWEFASGERIISEPSFEELAEKSGCMMPQESK